MKQVLIAAVVTNLTWIAAFGIYRTHCDAACQEDRIEASFVRADECTRKGGQVLLDGDMLFTGCIMGWR